MNKRKKLEKMATKILKQDEKNQNLKRITEKNGGTPLKNLISKLFK